MSQFARYTVIIERQLGESDFRADDHNPDGHNGFGGSAVEQLVKELQEGFDGGSIDGMFRVIGRKIVDGDTDRMADLPVRYQDDPDTADAASQIRHAWTTNAALFDAARALCADALPVNREYVRGVAEVICDSTPNLSQDVHKDALITILGAPL